MHGSCVQGRQKRVLEILEFRVPVINPTKVVGTKFGTSPTELSPQQ